MKLTALLLLLAGAGAQPSLVWENEMASKGDWMRRAHSKKVGRLLPKTKGEERERGLQTTIPEAPPSELTVAVASFEELKEVIESTTVATTVEVEQDIVFPTPVVIPADVTVWIVGSGSSAKKMDAASTSQHFIVYGKAWVENLWFVNGFGSNGGSIVVKDGGSLSARNSVFMNNTAVDMNSTAFDMNSTATSPSFAPTQSSSLPGGPGSQPVEEARPYPGAGDGGAIAAFNSSFIAIESCEFAANYASRMGGAIVAEDSSSLSVSDSAFSMNECQVAEIEGIHFGGGAIAVIESSILDVTNSSFTSNHAVGSGGAIYGSGNLRMSIVDSFFDGNTLDPGALGEFEFIPHLGGAVAALATSTVETTNNVFTNHKWFLPLFHRLQYGAAVTVLWGQYTSTNDLFLNNGVYIVQNTSTWHNSGFGTIEGGAIYGDGDGLVLTIKNATFQNNFAEFGGAMSVWSPASNESDAPIIATITDSQFTNNSVYGGGGALILFGGHLEISVSASTFSAGGAWNGGGIELFSPNFGRLSHYFTDLVFDHNIAQNGGGAISAVLGGGNLYLDNVECTENAARGRQGDGGGGLRFRAADWDRSTWETGIPNNFGYPVLFSLVATKIVNNSADLGGGGIDAGDYPPDWNLPFLNHTVYLDDTSIVTDNTAETGRGGGIYLYENRDFIDKMLVFNGSTVVNNFPEDVHANTSGVVLGTLATFLDAKLTGTAGVFQVGPSTS